MMSFFKFYNKYVCKYDFFVIVTFVHRTVQHSACHTVEAFLAAMDLSSMKYNQIRN